MVERIRVTSSRIITRNSSSNITFDTDRRYLKSDSSGQLLAGGYTRAPIVAGSSGTNLYDHTNAGGFIVNLSTEIAIPQEFLGYDGDGGATYQRVYTGHPYTLTFSAPAFDSLTLDVPQYYDRNVITNSTNGAVIAFQGNGRNIGTYRWSVYGYDTYSTIGESSTTDFNGMFLINYIALSEPFEGGTLTFPWPGITNYTYTWSSGYAYNQTTTILDYPQKDRIFTMFTPALYCTKTSINLALAVTP
ncbi:hypothetical protein EB001_03035 [bacterium]|nr:hypothetical protein [bacterium]